MGPVALRAKSNVFYPRYTRGIRTDFSKLASDLHTSAETRAGAHPAYKTQYEMEINASEGRKNETLKAGGFGV